MNDDGPSLPVSAQERTISQTKAVIRWMSVYGSGKGKLVVKQSLVGTVVCVALWSAASPALAYDGILTCWFNENGEYRGADGGNGEVGSLKRISESGDYTYGFFIAPNKECPKSIRPPAPAPEIGTVLHPDEGDVTY